MKAGGGAREKALFLSGYGDRLNPNYLGNWVSRTLKKSGINKSGSCHLLRHSCATHLHDNGIDIRFIQQLLGTPDSTSLKFTPK